MHAIKIDLSLFTSIETSCLHIRDATVVWKKHLTCPRRVYADPENEWESCMNTLQSSCMKINSDLRSIHDDHPDWLVEIYNEYMTIINLSHLFNHHFSSISKDTLFEVLTKTIPSLLTSVSYKLKMIKT